MPLETGGVGLWRASALEEVGQLEEEEFVAGWAHELEADGETSGGEAAGDGDGGDAGEIGRAVIAKEKGPHGVILVADADDFLADEGSRDGRGWNGERVDARALQGEMELLNELFAELESGEIDSCGDFGSDFEAGADVVAVVGGARGKPPGLLVMVSGFGPGDLIAGVFGFVQQGDREFLKTGALRFENADGLVEDYADIRRKHLEEEIFWNAESKFAGLGKGFCQRAGSRRALDEREKRFEK